MGLPNSIKAIYTYIKGLTHLDPIDYSKIEDLLFQAAKEVGIELHKNQSLHKFHWLLEGKLNTDGTCYYKNRGHLQSCDSLLDKSRSDAVSLDDETFKTLMKDDKEELKQFNSPSISKAQRKKK